MADERLDALARRVLDGADVDWASEDSTAPPDTRPLLAQLRVLAAVAQLHREFVPDRWAHLQVLECIGRGATATVYRAWDTRLDREVALKILPGAPSGTTRTSSIIDEGRMLAKVRHPNVVTIHGAEQIDDQIGLWMEFVRGRSLQALVEEPGPFGAAEVVSVGVEICRAVSAVHATGLLHCDIKAHNVMRADDGRILLMDFGAGRQRDDPSNTNPIGTPLYLAPEIFAGQLATARSDVYSIGVLLYYLLTGGYPVEGRTIQEVTRAHQGGERRRVDEGRPGFPAGLVDVIERATAHDPSRRHSDAEALGRELESALQLTTRRRSVMWRWIAVSAVAAMLTAGAWWVTKEKTEPVGAVLGQVTTIAVLPLSSIGTEAPSGQFADGLTTEIVRELSAIAGLAARSGPALRRSAGSGVDARAQLGSDYVVDGTVERTGDRVRVSVRLVRADGNVTAWSDVLDRGAGAPVSIQREIATAIANALQIPPGLTRPRHDLPFESNYLFVRASGLLARRGPEHLAQAIELLDQVVARSPDFALGWAALASTTATLSQRNADETMPPTDPRTMPAARRAIELGPLLPEAQAAAGSAAARARDWIRAEAYFERALELGPTLTTVYTDFVLSTLLPLGKLEEALERLQVARTADPLSLDVRRVMALIEVDSGRYHQAIASAEWVLERDPAFPYADTWLGRALALSGRHEDALAVLERNPINWGYVGYTLAVSGRRAEAEALAARHPESPSRQMLIYGGLGDKERAFEALGRAIDANWWRGFAWMRRPEVALRSASCGDRGQIRTAALAGEGLKQHKA